MDLLGTLQNLWETSGFYLAASDWRQIVMILVGCLLSPGQPGPLLKDTHLTKPPKSQPKALPKPSNIFLSSSLPLRSPADLARHRKKSCLTPFTYIRQKKVF